MLCGEHAHFLAEDFRFENFWNAGHTSLYLHCVVYRILSMMTLIWPKSTWWISVHPSWYDHLRCPVKGVLVTSDSQDWALCAGFATLIVASVQTLSPSCLQVIWALWCGRVSACTCSSSVSHPAAGMWYKACFFHTSAPVSALAQAH